MSACLDALTPATGALIHFFDIEFGFGAEGRIQEGQGQIIAEIGPPLGSASASMPRAEAEQIFEDIPKAGKNIFKPAEPPEPLAVQSLVTILIVDLTLFRVRENVVCFGGLLELILCIFVTGVAIRMVLQGKLSVGFFNVSIRSIATDAEYLVVISFGSH